MLKNLIEKLKKHDRAEIAYKSGVSLSVINNLIRGANDNPTIKTVEALQRFLDEKERDK